MKYTVLVNYSILTEGDWRERAELKQDIVEVNDLKELTNMFDDIQNIKIIEKTI